MQLRKYSKHVISEKEHNSPDSLFPFTVTCAHLTSETWLTLATDVLCRFRIPDGSHITSGDSWYYTHVANYTTKYTTFYTKYILFGFQDDLSNDFTSSDSSLQTVDMLYLLHNESDIMTNLYKFLATSTDLQSQVL